MHDAFISELRNSFSTALQRDKLYHRPCGHITDQMIWIVGVQMQYLVENVIRYDHADFLNALKLDLGPILGDIGIWVCKQFIDFNKVSGNNESKKKYMVCQEIIEKYLENKFDFLGQEKKY